MTRQIAYEDFLRIRKTRVGKEVVRCNCGSPHCHGWAEITKGEPWGYRPWEAPIGFVGPLETEY